MIDLSWPAPQAGCRFGAGISIAEVLSLPVNKVRVQYVEGSGTFGPGCYEACAQAAAVMSQAVGKPVRVQFMRSNQHGWNDYAWHAALPDVSKGMFAPRARSENVDVEANDAAMPEIGRRLRILPDRRDIVP
jgi:hypothetical protein